MKRTPARLLIALGLLALAAVPAFAQPKQPPPGGDPLPPEKEPPKVDQASVDAAIAKGSEWLRAKLKAGLPPIDEAGDGNHAGSTYNEIVLYTLLHAGVNRGDPDLIKLMNEIRGKPPVHTYTGAMRAMALALYDPIKLRGELVMNAQFLVDNQGKNGMWGYSKPIPWPALPKVTFTPSAAPPNYTLSGPGGGSAPASAGPPHAPAAPAAGPAGAADGAGVGPDANDGGGNAGAPPPPGGVRPGATGTSIVKPRTTEARKEPPKYQIPRRDWGQPNDNSNTQYAILGLRACMTHGILPPPDCLPTTEEWLTKQQNDDGGWNYQEKGKPSYGSMSAGGLSSLSVCIRGTKNTDPRKDPRIQKALQWMSQNLGYGNNPGKGKNWHFYWIYGVERAGALAETEWFGERPWYHEGATWLLRSQNGDGTWGTGTPGEQILNTCWAILFLRRATKHMIQKPKIEYTH